MRARVVAGWLGVACGGLLALLVPTFAQEKPAEEIVPAECLVLRPVGRYSRSAVHTDAVEAQVVAGSWKAPKEGDTVKLPDGATRTWEKAALGKDGWFAHQALAGGYASVAVPSEVERVMMLEASGHGMVYVNGEPRTGDPYQTGYVRLPILLKAGTNDLLFHVGRGRLRVKLVKPKAAAFFNLGDVTAPDMRVGELVRDWLGVIVVNATQEPLEPLTVVASIDGVAIPQRTPPIPPLTVRKVALQLSAREQRQDPKETTTVSLELQRTAGAKQEILDSAAIHLRLRSARQTQKRTFRSEIDGSVQYYAVNPATHAQDQSALFLTLHGAGVEAIGQADAYSPKSWGHLVAPTNRRPFGFDWEDWGRLDALEVLDLAQKELRTDPRRTYLTGHSMGGHGVWHVGVTFPDRFAALGPSAGWFSFWSYTGGKKPDAPSPLQEMLLRAVSPSDTLALANNYQHHGIYILHGDKDDNVPVTQARTMKEHLAKFHQDFRIHEQPGAGHWWDASNEAGTDCVDWAPMFDLFARRTLPTLESTRHVEFTTANPAVSARCHWAVIEAQLRQLRPSTVRLRNDPHQRRFVGTTENVARLNLDLRCLTPGKTLQVELDGQKLENLDWPANHRLWLRREGDQWTVAEKPPAAHKGPHRYGPFKEAFRQRMLFVHGTHGNAAENAWALAKARYDAETFWYRGNGSVEVLPDAAFDPAAERDRNVILYGNADTNTAWKTLLATSPVQVTRGRVKVGDRELLGDDLACLFLRPRPGSDTATVGVVTGSGLPGMRLTDRLPYFVSGVGYPDCTVFGSEMLQKGAEGMRGAGLFGLDWNVTTGEFVWRD